MTTLILAVGHSAHDDVRTWTFYADGRDVEESFRRIVDFIGGEFARLKHIEEVRATREYEGKSDLETKRE